MHILAGRKIILGVCGSIAAYKVVQLARNLALAGAQVDVVLTEAAAHFVGSATWQAVTGRPVLTDMWALPEDGVVGHIALGAHADLLLIAPASANTIAELAAGSCDNLLTTTALATRAPILLVPAMNPRMYLHPATQANLATLQQRGVAILEPAVGRMAEHEEGIGRLPEVDQLEAEVRALLGRRLGALRGRRVLVTAGGTHEPIDPVRFVGNRSSGRMGYALAIEARDRGADVTLISGPVALPAPHALRVVRVETALQMREAVQAAIEGVDLLFMAAAVADFRPDEVAEQKIKKGNDEALQLRLIRNPDILGELAQRRDLVKVGFAAETHSLLEYASDKLARKGLDMIIANDAVAALGSSENQVTILTPDGVIPLQRLPKEAVAAAILDHVLARFATRLAPMES